MPSFCQSLFRSNRICVFRCVASVAHLFIFGGNNMTSDSSEIYIYEDYTIYNNDNPFPKPIEICVQDAIERIRPLVQSHALLSKTHEYFQRKVVSMISAAIALAQLTGSVVSVETEDGGREITVSLVFTSFVLMEYLESLLFKTITEKADCISISTHIELCRSTIMSFTIDLDE